MLNKCGFMEVNGKISLFSPEVLLAVTENAKSVTKLKAYNEKHNFRGERK